MKKTIIGIVLAGLLIVLTACAQSNKMEASMSSAPSAFTEKTGQTMTPATLKNLKTDQSVDLAANAKSALPELTVKYKPFDEQKVLSSLMPGVSIKDMKVTPCEFSNGMKYNDYSRSTAGDYISIGYKLSYRTRNGAFYQKYAPGKNEDTKFKKNGELSFDLSANALEKVKSMLSQIGIENVSLKNMYAMDYQTLSAMEQTYSKTEGFENELKAGREIYKGNWSKEDDCYFFILRQELGGLPVYEDNYLASENDIINGTEIYVYYTQKGIEALDTNAVYEKLSAQNEAAVLSASDALKLIDAKYSDIILTSEATVTRMELMYVPTSAEETTQMLPAWRFSLAQDVTWESEAGMVTDHNTTDYYFNAFDGTELLCAQ